MITQDGKPIAFFSRKLSKAQRKYSVTELELLSIVECLKEFKGMLWGQKLRVYTDHKNLVRDALGLTCDRVYRWRLLLEEYEPETVYIKGVDNIVADALSRLEYDPDQKVKILDPEKKCFALVRLFTHYSQERDTLTRGGEIISNPFQTYAHTGCCDGDDRPNDANNETQDQLLNVFANTSEKEEDIYPPTIVEIASEQRRHKTTKRYFEAKPFKNRDKKISLKLIDDTELLVYEDKRLVIPGIVMQSRVVQWYHHYLQHPGANRLEETLVAVMYWPGMRYRIRKYVKSCNRCQKNKSRKRKYGKLPPKIAETVPWKRSALTL